MVAPQMPGPEWGPGGAGQVPEVAGWSGALPAPPGAGGAHADRGARRETLKARIRLVGSIAIAVLAVLTLGFLGPDSESHAVERLTIWAEDSGNQERTQGAPQQSVVNGWTGNALLDLISEQLDDAAQPDHRPAVLLTLGVLLLALAVATTPSDPRERRLLVG